MKNRLILPLLILAFFSILLLIYQTTKVESAGERIVVGEKAPDFTLRDLKGDNISLSSFFGKKVVLLDFSTTWCPYCLAITPLLKDIHTNYEEVEVAVVYIKESRISIERFVKKHQIPYTTLLDRNGAVASEYRIRGIPTVILISKDGIIKYRGHRISKAIIEEMVKG